jgi:hypothetical protein
MDYNIDMPMILPPPNYFHSRKISRDPETNSFTNSLHSSPITTANLQKTINWAKIP